MAKLSQPRGRKKHEPTNIVWTAVKLIMICTVFHEDFWSMVIQADVFLI